MFERELAPHMSNLQEKVNEASSLQNLKNSTLHRDLFIEARKTADVINLLFPLGW